MEDDESIGGYYSSLVSLFDPTNYSASDKVNVFGVSELELFGNAHPVDHHSCIVFAGNSWVHDAKDNKRISRILTKLCTGRPISTQVVQCRIPGVVLQHLGWSPHELQNW